MSQLVLNRGSQTNLLSRFFSKFESGPFFVVVSLVLFVTLITVITLMFSTRQVTKGYVMNQLETEHQELLRESEMSDMQISKARSLSTIQNSSKVASMVNPDRIVFLGGDTAIASR